MFDSDCDTDTDFSIVKSLLGKQVFAYWWHEDPG
jgi:hypothetical protein